MSQTSLLDRAIYSYADVDRLIGLSPGTARRWIDGYRGKVRSYPPVLRSESTGSESVTWGEMVEARLLAEFRGQRVPLQRLRPAVERLRDEFGPYPLAHAHPLLDVEGREVVRRVRTDVLAEEYRAGESRENLADLYDLTTEQVDQAIRFEMIAASAHAA